MNCGAPLPAPARVPTGTRKVVTALFCDVVGSTRLGERLDAESVRDLMIRYFDEVQGILVRHGGTVEKYIGDAVLAIFGVPTLHEDDALRAVRAAAEIRDEIGRIAPELEERWGAGLQVRIGVNTGEVAVQGPGEGDSLVVGDAVNVAARLEQAAGPGEILLGPDTHGLVRHLVRADAGQAFSLKGKRDPVLAYRLLEVVPGSGSPRPEPGLVDRTEELDALRRTFEDVLRERRSRLVLLTGSAGMGKSRLAREFARGVDGTARTLRGRCLPYGEGITFWPIAEIVRDAVGILENDSRADGQAKIAAALEGLDDRELVAERVGTVLGLSPPAGGIQETYWAIRRFLERVASPAPLVVIFDDIQWAEPALLDLVEYLAGWIRDVPVMLLGLARPELLDTRPAWRASAATSLSLTPLSTGESDALVANLLGAALDPPAVARISEAAGGNPLFVEELLRMLEDEGVLIRDGTWRVATDLSQREIPPSIHALLAARLDLLTPGELAVIRAAAVVGMEFWWGAVVELVPEDLATQVGTHLQTLVRKELIRPERSSLPGEDAFAFHHLLIQEAAYRGMPKEARAALHERFADWVEARAGERLVEQEEILGYHLEQAVRYRSELGGSVERHRPLAERAAGHLASAGRRALDRGDVSAAADLLDRACSLYAPASSARLVLLPALAEALAETGDLPRAERTLGEAQERALEAGDRGVEAHAKVISLLMLESTDPKARSEVARSELDEVIEAFEELGDDLGLARAWRLIADVEFVTSRYAAADEALRHAIDHARAAGAIWEESEALGQYIACGVYGPVPMSEVLLRCERSAEVASATPALEARRLRGLAHVAAMEGRFDEARDLVRRARERLEDVGLRLRAAFVAESAGYLEHLAGDHAAAERELRRGYETGLELGEQAFTATVGALIAHELAEQDRLEEAEELVRSSAEAGAEGDLTTHIVWRGAKALVLAARDELEEAERLVRDAVGFARETDDLNMVADALVDLSTVLGSRHPADVEAALMEALGLYRTKGNLVSAMAVERRLEALGG